jgi:multicomponent Na+:H+ antiporter subunit F
MTVSSQVALGLLIAATVLTVARAVRPSSAIGDRAVAFDMVASLIQSGLFVGAVLLGDGVLVEIALLLGLLGFLTSVTVARFIERTDP